MGKVKPDLAGAYVSKVGGVAYYIKDGVNYVRSLSKSEYKSNTPLQAEVKARFKSASQMAGQMKEIAKVGFPQRKRGITPKNAWHSANKECFRKQMKALRSILKNSNFRTVVFIRGGDADLRPGVADLYSKLSGDAGRKQLPSG